MHLYLCWTLEVYEIFRRICLPKNIFLYVKHGCSVFWKFYNDFARRLRSFLRSQSSNGITQFFFHFFHSDFLLAFSRYFHVFLLLVSSLEHFWWFLSSLYSYTVSQCSLFLHIDTSNLSTRLDAQQGFKHLGGGELVLFTTECCIVYCLFYFYGALKMWLKQFIATLKYFNWLRKIFLLDLWKDLAFKAFNYKYFKYYGMKLKQFSFIHLPRRFNIFSQMILKQPLTNPSTENSLGIINHLPLARPSTLVYSIFNSKRTFVTLEQILLFAVWCRKHTFVTFIVEERNIWVHLVIP